MTHIRISVSCSMSREVVICCPERYFSESFQSYIRNNCLKEDRQWIYNLISDESQPSSECVYEENSDWLLCLDKHPGSDTRFLVVFRDLSLKTIRDLRQIHAAMLVDMTHKVRRSVRRIMPEWEDVCIYFHYHPSVYQLHAHVCQVEQMCRSSYYSRRHDVRHVVRNLRTDSLWYHNALILTSKNKGMRHVVSFDEGRALSSADLSVNWKARPIHTI